MCFAFGPKTKGGYVKTYEQMFVLNPVLDEEQEKKLVEKLTSAVESGGGQVLDSKRWGKRRLAYDIKGQIEGTYWVLTFKSEGQVPAELRRVVKITEGFLRDIIVDLTDFHKAQRNREVYAKLAEARRAARIPREKKEPTVHEEIPPLAPAPAPAPIVPEEAAAEVTVEEPKVE